MKLIDLLSTHDWAYEYIDGGPGWDRGNEQRKAILKAIRTPSDAIVASLFIDRVPTPEREAYLVSINRALEINMKEGNE